MNPAPCLLLTLLLSACCCLPQDPADAPFRAGTIERHENGELQRALLAEPAELGGYPCRECVRCVGSVFHAIRLHPNGRLRSAKLAADARIAGVAFEKGDAVTLDAQGKPAK